MQVLLLQLYRYIQRLKSALLAESIWRQNALCLSHQVAPKASI